MHYDLGAVRSVSRDAGTKQSNITIGWDLLDAIDARAFGISEAARAASMRINDIVVADFISHLAENRKNMASMLDVTSQRLVLLLGRFRG